MLFYKRQRNVVYHMAISAGNTSRKKYQQLIRASKTANVTDKNFS